MDTTKVPISDLSPQCQVLFKRLLGLRAALRELSEALGDAEVLAWDTLRQEHPELPDSVKIFPNKSSSLGSAENARS